MSLTTPTSKTKTLSAPQPRTPQPRSTQSPTKPAGTLLGTLSVLGAAALWGTTGTAATFAPEVGPLAMGAAALGIGGLLQALVALPALYRARAALRANIGTIITGAIGVFIYPLAFYSSMHLAGVAIGTVVSLGRSEERRVGTEGSSQRW